MSCGTGECGCGCGELHQIRIKPDMVVKIGRKEGEEDRRNPLLAGEPGQPSRPNG